VSRVLRWLALALALVTAAVLFGPVWADSGGFAVWALGLPVLLCVAPIAVSSSRYSVAVTWLVATALLAWSLLLGLGVGLFLLPAALVEVAAAAAQTGRADLHA
jgi:hypothetical protein